MTDFAEVKNIDNQAALEALTGDELRHALGWDTTRLWANAVQVYLSPDHVLFVLREQINAEAMGPEGSLQKRVVGNNVGSFVLPVKVAKQFAAIMNILDFDGAMNAASEG